MTELLAVYAALVATASLSWQIYTWRRLNRVHVSVDAALETTHFPSIAAGSEALRIGFRNDSGRPVTVAQVGGQYPGRQPWVIEPTDPPAALPVVVPAGERQVVYVRRCDRKPSGAVQPRSDDIFRRMRSEATDGVSFWVQLETGERFRSKKFNFRPGRDALEQRAVRPRLLRR